MKKITLIAMLIVALMALNVAMTMAQTTVKVKDTGTEYVEDTTPKTVEQVTAGCKKSEKVFRDKNGNTEQVYIAPSGKPFIVAISKTSGNAYRKYLSAQ